MALSPSALYESAQTAGRDLLPLPRDTVPQQNVQKVAIASKMDAAQHRQNQRLRRSLLSVKSSKSIDVRRELSRLKESYSEDARWLRDLSGGNLLPRNAMSHEIHNLHTNTHSHIESARNGERLLGAINRMEKYLSRDVLLQELSSKETIEKVITNTQSSSNIEANNARNRSFGESSNSSIMTTSNLDMKRSENLSSDWLLRESKRLSQTGELDKSLASNISGGSSLGSSHCPPHYGSSSHNTTMVGGDPIAAKFGLPTIPDRNMVNQSTLHQHLIGAPEQSAAAARKRAQASRVLPSTFSMPNEMVNAVSNIAPFRSKLNRSSLVRGDWVAEKESFMTKERLKAAKMASANVVPPFWNPNDTETVVQYGRGGHRHEMTQCVAKYDYNYEAEHAAVTLQRVMRGHMMRLDIFKPWGARDRWMAVKIQRQYRRWMAQREYRMLCLVRGIQGQYRDPYCRIIQRVWRGILGRRRFKVIREEKYSALVKIQTQWRMMVARERVKFRKSIRDKWCARHIQRVFRGHFHGRLRLKQKRFVLNASKRLKEDSASLWGLIHFAMRLHVLRHDWRKLPKGYLSENSPAAWHKVVRKPRLEAEGIEGTLIKNDCRGTKTRLLSHALYQLKKDGDHYCISLFPPRISVSSYILNLSTDLPTGRGPKLAHFFVASMYQLSCSAKTSLQTLENKFVIEAFDPESNQECVPYLVQESLVREAAASSKHGVSILDGGRRIVDLRPWIINNLRLVKTAQARSTHGVRIISPLLERARRRMTAINAASLLQRRVRGRGGKLSFAIAQSRQRERMRQVTAALMRRSARLEFKKIRNEAATDVQRVWVGMKSRKRLKETLARRISTFMLGDSIETRINGNALPWQNGKGKRAYNSGLLDDHCVVFKGRRIRVGGGLHLRGMSVGHIVDGFHASGIEPGRYLYVTCTQDSTGFDLAVSEEPPKEPVLNRKRSFMETDEDIAAREAEERAAEEAKIKFRGRIDFAEILPLLEDCPMLNFESLNREALLIRLLSLCELEGAQNDSVEENRNISLQKEKTRNLSKIPKSALCQHGRRKMECPECTSSICLGNIHNFVGADTDNLEIESNPVEKRNRFVTLPVCEHAFRLCTKHLSMVTRRYQIVRKELDLKTVALQLNNENSEQRLSLDVSSLEELKEDAESGVEDRKQVEKLFSRLSQDVIQQFQWLKREQRKAERAQKTLLRDLKNAEANLEKRTIASKMAKAAVKEIEDTLNTEPIESEIDNAGESGNIQQVINPELQKEAEKKLRKLRTLVKKEDLLLQAADAAVKSKSSLASIYQDFAVAADKGLELGSKLKDTFLETIDCCGTIRKRFDAMINHQKENVLQGLSNQYDRLSCLRLACASAKDKRRLRDEVIPECQKLEEDFRIETEVLEALSKRALRASLLQATTFNQIEKLMERQRDNDLDLMSLFEQELSSWQTIAFEGPRSRKGRTERDRVSRTYRRRTEKEKLRIELAELFDGSIRQQEWQAFVTDSEGLVGEIRPPSKFRRSSCATHGDEALCDVAEEQWDAETYIKLFRTQYFRHQQIKAKLLAPDGIIGEAQRIPSFSC